MSLYQEDPDFRRNFLEELSLDSILVPGTQRIVKKGARYKVTHGVLSSSNIPVFAKAYHVGYPYEVGGFRYELTVYYRLRQLMEESPYKEELQQYFIRPLRFLREGPFDITVTEDTGGFTLWNNLERQQLDDFDLLCVSFQMLYCIYLLKLHGITHNDLFGENVVLEELPEKKQRTFNFGTFTYTEPRGTRFQCKAFDFDRSLMSVDSGEIKPNVTLDGDFCDYYGQCNVMNTYRDVFTMFYFIVNETGTRDSLTDLQNYLVKGLKDENEDAFDQIVEIDDLNEDEPSIVFCLNKPTKYQPCQVPDDNPLLEVELFTKIYHKSVDEFLKDRYRKDQV